MIYYVLQVKHLQFLSGIHSSSYWLASYAWDLLNTLIPIVLIVIIFAAFQVDTYRSSQVLGAIFILLVTEIIIQYVIYLPISVRNNHAIAQNCYNTPSVL